MLLDVHDDVVDILSLYCLRLLEILEQFEKAAILRDLSTSSNGAQRLLERT